MQTGDLISYLSSGGRSKKFCFIMGSGCSVENGIPTGRTLASKWYSELSNIYSAQQIERWRTDENIGDDFGASYAKIFQFRFAGDPNSGYEAINLEIEKGRLGIGHILLSQIMLKTGSNVVITTNFDTLVEETLYTFTNSKPIMVGHESVAKYARPSADHPLIVKIHRDRFMDPFNLDGEIAVLRPEWESVLNYVFENFIPIVLGYGGNDGSLMGYLMAAKPCERMFWCITSDRPLRQEILEVVTRHNGNFVKIEGFNRLMLRFAELYKIRAVDRIVSEKAARLPKDYIDSLLKLSSRIIDSGDKDEQRSLNEITESFNSNDWWFWELKARSADTIEDKYKIYEKGLKAVPDSADLHYYYGWELIDNFPDQALKPLKKAIRLQPGLKDAWYCIGLIYQRKGKFKTAVTYFQKAVEIASSFAVGWKQLASAYHSAGHYVMAVDAYRTAIKEDPRNPSTWNNLGFTYKALGNFEEAVSCFKQASDLEPRLAEPWFNIGNIYYQKGEDSKAISYYEKAVGIKPDYADAWHNMGLSFENLNEKAQARNSFGQAHRIEPTDQEYKKRYDANG
jgi:tetratricopeptide (TPR) repeat protein